MKVTSNSFYRTVDVWRALQIEWEGAQWPVKSPLPVEWITGTSVGSGLEGNDNQRLRKEDRSETIQAKDMIGFA